MSSTNRDDEQEVGVDWQGMERCPPGGTIEMLLDLDEGTLTVYRNNRRLGVMKSGPSGSYCWHTTVSAGNAVAIKRGTYPSNWLWDRTVH